MTKNWLDKSLSIFADVRAGEGFRVIVLALNVFTLLGSYYLLKTVREALILSEGGAATKTYSSAAQAVLLMLLVPAFGFVASRVNRVRLIASVLAFFICNLLIFNVLGLAGVHTGVVFFIWVGIFNVMAPSQFWAFANDLYTDTEGKRLFPVIGIGASLGAWLGAVAAGKSIKSVGPFGLMLAAAVMIGLCIVLTVIANRQKSPNAQANRNDVEPLSKEGGFELLFKDRYLLFIATLMIILNLVNTVGEYILSTLVVEASKQAVSEAEQAQWIGAFYGGFFGWVNLISFLLQSFVVSRVFRYIGVGGALFVMPIIAFGSYLLMALRPVLSIVRIFKIAENSVDYSIQNTTRQALFLPTSRVAKYKAKQVIDAFCMRLGDVLAAGLVFLGANQQWGVATFASVNIALTLAWVVVAFLIAREYQRRTSQGAQPPAAAERPAPQPRKDLLPGRA